MLAPLKYKGCIEASDQCNTEQSLSMNLITHPQRLFSLAVSFGKEKQKITEGFEAHRLKIKLQNESNANTLKL